MTKHGTIRTPTRHKERVKRAAAFCSARAGR